MELTIDRALRPGMTVALGDGAGMPVGLCAALSDRARELGDIRLITGWILDRPADLDFSAFADVRTFMAGYGLADSIADGSVKYVPTSVSQLPALLAGPWRPDVALVSARSTTRGLVLGSEVAWMAAAIDHADICLVELNAALPDAARDGKLPKEKCSVVAASERPPIDRPPAPHNAVASAIAEQVVALIPEGAAVQVGPGAIGDSVLEALSVPVSVDSGIISDAVADLDRRGLLLGDALGTYVVGSRAVYDWADGRRVLERIEYTHNPARLAAKHLITVNTAIQIDGFGQINVERLSGRSVAGIGGHPDFVLAGSRSTRGLSVIALPSQHRGRSALVDRLTEPASTPRSAVDVVVTEHGVADLRGLSDSERRIAIERLFDR